MPQDPRRPFWRRLLRQLWRSLKWPVLASLLLVACVGFFPSKTINPLVRWAGPKTAAKFGYDLSVDQISGSPWSGWTFAGLSLEPQDGEHGLRVSRLETVQVELARPVWKKPGLHNLRKVTLSGGQVSFVGGPDADESENGQPASDPFDWRTLPEISLDSIQVHVETKTLGSIDLASLHAQFPAQAPTQSARPVSLQIPEGVWQRPTGESLPFAVDCVAEWEPDQGEFSALAIEADKYGAVEGQIKWSGKHPLDAEGEYRLAWSGATDPWVQDTSGVVTGTWSGSQVAITEATWNGNAETSVAITQATVDLAEEEPWKTARAQIAIQGANLGRWMEALAPSAPIDVQTLELTASLENMRLSGSMVEAKILPTGGPDSHSAQPLTVAATGTVDLVDPSAPLLSVSGSLELPEGSWTDGQDKTVSWLASQLQFGFDGQWLEGTGFAQFEGSQFSVGQAGMPTYDGQLFGELRLNGQSLDVNDLRAQWSTKQKSIGHLQLNGSAGQIASWVQDPGAVRMELAADIDLLDLRPLADWLPALRQIEGDAQGRLTWNGSLEAPNWDGDLKVRAPYMRLTEGDRWSDVLLTVALQSPNIASWKGSATYGGAPLALDGSLLWQAADSTIEMNVKGQALPLVKNPSARVRADIDLNVTGGAKGGQVRGSATVVHGQVYHDFDLTKKLFAALEGADAAAPEPGAGAQALVLEWPIPESWDMDLSLSTKNPIRVKADLASTEVSVQGKLKGSSGRLYPEGNVTLNGGAISLPGTTMEWTQGVILLPKGGGLPTIEATGEARLSGHDISLRVHGDLAQPVLELTSSPSRPQYDLLVLLLTGELPGNRDLSRATQSLSVYLAKDLLRRWLGSDPSGEESLLDRLEFSTGREVSESGLGTLEAMFRLQGDLDGKRRSLWITAERDRYEDMNFGFRFVLRPK